jgi:hypothetical protein
MMRQCKFPFRAVNQKLVAGRSTRVCFGHCGSLRHLTTHGQDARAINFQKSFWALLVSTILLKYKKSKMGGFKNLSLALFQIVSFLAASRIS